jgi:hypothetical protein
LESSYSIQLLRKRVLRNLILQSDFNCKVAEQEDGQALCQNLTQILDDLYKTYFVLGTKYGHPITEQILQDALREIEELFSKRAKDNLVHVCCD